MSLLHQVNLTPSGFFVVALVIYFMLIYASVEAHLRGVISFAENLLLSVIFGAVFCYVTHMAIHHWP